MMSSVSRWLRVGVVLAILVECTNAKTLNALSVPPSLNWYGDDGTWSSLLIRVGTPQQWIDVMVSTVSSETWVVGTGACKPNDSLCITSRGGHLFDPLKSTTWHSEGFFSFSADTQLGNQGYGWYGLDDLTFGSTGVTVSDSIIADFNGTGPTVTTQYMLGQFGLGAAIAQFNNDDPLPALNALVERNGIIPSHSWGFTAGAHYQQKGEPLSLTLGGYDANRLIPHNVTFNLNPIANPQASINSVFVSSGSRNDNFSTPIQLLQSSDRVSAVIDSSTPFLWFPGTVCDRFAEILGLTYNDSLNLYTYEGNASQHDVLANSDLSFTFSLSDLSSTPASINITLPFAAFDLQLTYPAIPNSTYGDPDATKNYFPLRRALDDSQYTIGRAFLQEAYLITDYERNIFSVHQAVHTANPLGNTSIVSITQPKDSTFTSPGGANERKLSKGAIIGIAIGSAILLPLFAFLAFSYYRRQNQRKAQAEDEKKEPTATSPQLRSFFSRLLHREQTYEAHGNTTFPTEVAADATHERYELPAPLSPVELDSEAGTTFNNSTLTSSTQDTADLSAYERARRKLARAQIVAAQAQARMEREASQHYPVEKHDGDVSQVAHYRAPDSPASPSTEEGLVSPLAPEPGWGTLALSNSGSGGSSSPSPVSPGFVSSPVSPIGPPPIYRRFGLDPANVVYAGRLPDNIPLPPVVPRAIGLDGRTIPNVHDEDNASLGSEYTIREEEELYRSGDTPVVSPLPGNVSDLMSASTVSRSAGSGNSREVMAGHDVELPVTEPSSSRRRLQGDDFIHVPQPAENRFSWEEDRIAGSEGGTL